MEQLLLELNGHRSGSEERWRSRPGGGESAMIRGTRRSATGFTLVEVLIVIAILGIILAVALPQFQTARRGAHARACQHNLKQILGAKERWAMDTNRSPSDTPNWGDLVVPGVYLKHQPYCPANGTYTVGRLDELPQCSIGGDPSSQMSHIIP